MSESYQNILRYNCYDSDLETNSKILAIDSISIAQEALHES